MAGQPGGTTPELPGGHPLPAMQGTLARPTVRKGQNTAPWRAMDGHQNRPNSAGS